MKSHTVEPQYETRIGKYQIRFWYDSKTHKYAVIVETEHLEPWTKTYSKAKAETIINFLTVIS